MLTRSPGSDLLTGKPRQGQLKEDLTPPATEAVLGR